MKKRSLTELSEAEREQALCRFRLIQPFLEEGVPLTKIAVDSKESLSTLRRWVQKYRMNGLTGLVRHQRGDKGVPRKITEDTKRLIEGLALSNPSLSSASIHRQVMKYSNENSLPSPCYRTVYDIIKDINPALKALAKGPKEYENTFDLIHRREASKPNEIWQADHSILDIWLIDEEREPIRPWLTIILDDYSRAIAGYYLTSSAPSILNTSLALRQAIWRKEIPHWKVCGIPEVFYTDNGSDFTSNHLEQVSAEIKMRLVFSMPGKPRGRGKIERFFRTINQMFLSTLPGYIPNKYTSVSSPKLTMKEFEEKLLSFLLNEYHTRIHGETHSSPQKRWEEHGFLPRLPESLEQLDLLLITVAKTRRIQQDGIRFQNFRYTDLNLSGYIGEDVIIRYDPRDLAEIRVYDTNNRFICRAICYELSGQNMSLKEIIRTRNQHKKQLQSELEDRLDAVNKYINAHKPVSSLNNPSQSHLGTENANDSSKQNKSQGLKRYRNE
jgi:putative transposase